MIFSRQSPVTSHQLPVNQSPVTSHQLPVTQQLIPIKGRKIKRSKINYNLTQTYFYHSSLKLNPDIDNV